MRAALLQADEITVFGNNVGSLMKYCNKTSTARLFPRALACASSEQVSEVIAKDHFKLQGFSCSQWDHTQTVL